MLVAREKQVKASRPEAPAVRPDRPEARRDGRLMYAYTLFGMPNGNPGQAMKLAAIAQIAGPLWGVSEIILGRVTRARRGATQVRDRGSLLVLWLVIWAGISAAFVFRALPATRMPIRSPWVGAASLALLVVGLSIRWTAIITLGRFFTSNVAIHQEHQLVRTGLYRHIRHPSYTGLLAAFGGVALSFGNWLSLVAVVVPVTLALLYRVRVEEAALKEAFGQTYTEYCKSTKRLLPGLY